MNMIVIFSVFSISDLKYEDIDPYVSGRLHRQNYKAFQIYVSPPIPRRGRCVLQSILLFGYWVILHAFLLSADFIQNHFFFQKILSGIPSECLTVWNQIRPDIMSGLNWVQTVCKGYHLFVWLLYVPSQQLWSLRDGQFT